MSEETKGLDQDQALVALATADARQIVQAGPGAGKTETLAALVDHLVEAEGLSPSDELLVLSFSQSAVHAVRARARGAGHDPALTVRTIDSTATRVLQDAEPDGDWSALGYDQRVARASQLLAEGLTGELSLLSHLIVDEIQDVVGVRAEFLLRLLDGLPTGAGFTLLGDPLQALYDFQRPEGDLDSQGFLEAVRRAHSPIERTLHGSYRALSADARAAAGLRPNLLAASSAVAQGKMVDRFVSGLPVAGAMEHIALAVPRWGGTTAFLCRSNGEVLSARDKLGMNGVRSSLTEPAERASVARWVADALSESPNRTVDREDLASALGDSGVDVGSAWRDLRRLARSTNRGIDIVGVAESLRSGPAPASLRSAPETNLVVSTIHRAKGLEFDNVVLVNPLQPILRSSESELGDEVRVLFVAVTRARQRLSTVEDAPLRLWYPRRLGRWVLSGQRPRSATGMELIGSDTYSPDPPGSDPGAAQEKLRFDVRPGETVGFELDKARTTLDRPVYSVMYRGVQIGALGPDFADSLAAVIGTASRRTGKPWPDLQPAMVERIVTISGTPQRHRDAGRWGIWRGVVLSGLVRWHW